MLSKEETQHIAKLARLGLKEEEIEKYRQDLSSILDYIEKLKEPDIEGVEPFTHALEVSNVFREDVARLKNESETQKLKDLMPEKQEESLKVKSVF